MGVHPAPYITLSITFTLKFSCILHFLITGCTADDAQLFLIRIPFHENSYKYIITQQSGLKLLREILSIDTNKIQSIPNGFEHFYYLPIITYQYVLTATMGAGHFQF